MYTHTHTHTITHMYLPIACVVSAETLLISWAKSPVGSMSSIAKLALGATRVSFLDGGTFLKVKFFDLSPVGCKSKRQMHHMHTNTDR